MRLLVLGGSWFLGAQIVNDALAAGSDVTTFRRGRTGADIAGAHTIRGDRTNVEDLARLADAGPWDAVIDTSGYVPANVGLVARHLAPTAHRYVFLSTVSVYRDWPARPVTETDSLRPCDPSADSDDGSPSDPGPARYGAFKAGAEQAVVDTFGTDRAVLLRPGVIVGPGEYVGRLPWWLQRIARAGRVLAPGRPETTIQPVDVRDVSQFAIHALQNGAAGAYNLAGPDTPFEEFLAACLRVTGSNATLEWITDEEWLAERVSPWVEMPLWHTQPGAWSADTSRARRDGFDPRPLTRTVAETWSWMRDGTPPVNHPRAGLIGVSPTKENAVLTAWADRQTESGR